MTLKEKIREDLNLAIKGKKEKEISVLRLLLSGIENKEKEKRYNLTKEETGLEEQELSEKSSLNDEEITEVVFSEAKKRKESISEFEKGGREELARKEKEELEVLKKYLPEQMGEQELKKIIENAIQESGAESMKDIGKVMSSVMPKVKGKADGSEVNRIAKELLS
jgi:uncharacterized protein